MITKALITVRIALIMFLSVLSTASADEYDDPFLDQEQYELFYVYTLQHNLVEFLISDCSGDRSIGWDFSTATSIGNEFKEYILGISAFVDPFTGKSLKRRLFDELWIGLTRQRPQYATEPTLLAQIRAHEMIDENKDELFVVCDLILWEEVVMLEAAVGALLKNTLANKDEVHDYLGFKMNTNLEMRGLKEFFTANPLRYRNE